MSPVMFTCPACQGVTRVTPDMAGRRIRCPRCKAPWKHRASPPATSPRPAGRGPAYSSHSSPASRSSC